MIKKNRKFMYSLLAIFLLSLFTSNAMANFVGEQKVSILKQGDACPDFAFRDTADNKISISSLKGHYVFIDVWASWCYPCRKELPYLESLEDEMKDKNIYFLSLSLDKSLWRWKGALSGLKMKGLQWNVLDDDFEKVFDIATIPRFILLDSTGKIIQIRMTAPSKKETLDYLLSLNNI
ncbi:MAG: TlpA family protein disulfide reductase [Bacteroidetes bacterium]|jgi:thiol-disulfide isomerase/thioredoxin|nr:TlpA family protein disulfide reductase [Bacteroidota bacterium]